MTTDLDTRLADLRRPPQWPAGERAAVLERVLDAEPVPHRADVRLISSRRRGRGRRAAAFATAAGLAAAACIAVPTILPSDSPGSATQAEAVQALHRLANVAAASPIDQAGPNQYLHLVDVGHQAALAGQPASDTRYEYWIRPDGLTYQRRFERDGDLPARREIWWWPAGPQFVDGMTSAVYLDRLPTDPAGLETYVRAHTSGSTSADERVFVAVCDIVRRGLASPALRSAAIEVLARLGHVRLGSQTRDFSGDPVQAFDFVDPHGRPGDVKTVLFDTRTAQITEERERFHGKLFITTTVPVFEVVTTVPASVREHAVRQK